MIWVLNLTFLDYFIIVLISVVLIVGAYQFYFWCQRQFIRPRKRLLTFFDSWFGYHPIWIWIYGGLYYPVIIFVVLTIRDMHQFVYIVFSYLILLALQMAFFLLFPVESPISWRKLASGNTLSERFLRLVMKFDADSNCFPSMHVSVAMLTSLHILNNYPGIGLGILSFPLLIALSALYTKRHYFLDLIPGALLGWGVFKIFQFIYVVWA